MDDLGKGARCAQRQGVRAMSMLFSVVSAHRCRSNHHRIALEALLIKLSKVGVDISVDTVLEKLAALGAGGLQITPAAAKSPPAMPLKAKGKLFGPKTTTGPMGPSIERIPVAVSIVGCLHDSDRAASAACRSWFVVRGNSPSLSRGETGSAVSWFAASTRDRAGATSWSTTGSERPWSCSN